MRSARALQRALTIVVLGFSASCQSADTAPRNITPFDARHALDQVNPIAAVFDQPILQSFDAALSFYEGFFRSTAVSLDVAPRGGSAASLTGHLVPVARVSAAVIPDGDKGKTFVYDPASGTYLVDLGASGAPANGVRFVLYAWGGPNGRPGSPLTRLGYVDIAPAEGASGSADQTELLIVRDAPFLPIADFVVTHQMMNGVSTFGITGSATDGFTEDIISLDGSDSGGAGQHHLIYNTTLTSSPPAVSASEQIVSDQATASQTGKLALSYEGHTFTDESVGAGTEIRFDGSVYARVLFPQSVTDDTRYLRPDGSSLSQQEIADLNALLDRVIVANFFWINLAWP